MAGSLTRDEETSLMDDFFATTEFVPPLTDEPDPDDSEDEDE